MDLKFSQLRTEKLGRNTKRFLLNSSTAQIDRLLALTKEMPERFTDFGLDSRLSKAISKIGWSVPSLVQEKVIPLALDGKDVVIRAKTGSGKTGAYTIPLVQKVLKAKKKGCIDFERLISIILVPSKELCKQVYRNILELCSYCSRDVTIFDAGNSNVQNSKALVSNADILIGTPSKILAHINNETINITKDLKYLVIDEADIMFSYGYENDIHTFITYLPKIYQAMLVSATFSKDVESLKNIMLHNPVSLRLRESEFPEKEKLRQYIIKCETSDKFLLIYALFKLNLIQGKSLIFVNSVDKCYRLKLFFEKFYVKNCVLNSELPQSSRVHIVDAFNRGEYDIIIATDEAISVKRDVMKKKPKKQNGEGNEYSASRGIDFQDVDNVINFDFPTTSDSYIHRIGRTARGHNSGTALSFVTSLLEQDYLTMVEEYLKSDVTDSSGAVLKPYHFKVNEIEAFRYRVNDAYNSISRIKIKNARMMEIKGQILNSSKLKSYFEENPKDLKVLRHDKILVPTDQKPHMKNIPDYLVPDALKHVMLKPKRKRKKNITFHEKNKKAKNDPLKSFKYRKRSK